MSSITNSLVSLALPGTSGRTCTCSLPKLQPEWERIQQESADSEEAFYRLSALVFAYRRAGLLPDDREVIYPISESPEETLPYLSQEVESQLVMLLTSGLSRTLAYGLDIVARAEQIISPERVYTLLSEVYKKYGGYSVACRADALKVSGNRGQWCLPFLGIEAEPPLEVEHWEVSSQRARLQLLRQVRREDPRAAIPLVERTWREETAASREALLSCFSIGLSMEDEEFLSAVMAKDRSQKVREVARSLLGSLPAGQLVRRYCELLKGHLKYGRILGWSYTPIPYSPELKELGIAEVSPNKGESDEHYILRQIAERVPLTFWMEFYETTDPRVAAQRLAKVPPFASYFSITSPILTLRDRYWAYWVLQIQNDSNTLEELVGLLSPTQREDIDYSHYKARYGLPERWIAEDEEAWGPHFSNEVLRIIITSSHFYSRPEKLEQIGLSLHPKVMASLSGCLNPDGANVIPQTMTASKQSTIQDLYLIMQTKAALDKAFPQDKQEPAK